MDQDRPASAGTKHPIRPNMNEMAHALRDNGVVGAIVTPSTVAGIWTEVPRQPKQRRCHECGKRTFYWLLEKEGAVCDDCANLRTIAKPSPRSAPDARANNGKKSKSTIATVVKNAILAKRANGQSKLSIAKEMHVAPGTVRNVLNEADFDQAVSEGRFESVKLIPRAINGLGIAMDKGDGATCNRFLENVGVIGEKAMGATRRNTARDRPPSICL